MPAQKNLFDIQEPPVVLLLGGTGQLGFELKRSLAPLARIEAPTRKELDLSELQAVRDYLRSLKPVTVVNAAAYTAVDLAESEPKAADVLNRQLPQILAEEVEQQHSLLIHYSTDYVFDGRNPEPYTEAHPVSPINEYGRSKAAGEAGIQNATNRYIILRTSWVLGAYGHNFMRTILKLASTRSELRVVGDQMGAPTSAPLIADCTAHIWRTYWLHKQIRTGSTLSEKRNIADPFPFGLYHLTSSGYTDWHELACHIVMSVRQKGVQLMLEPKNIQRIRTAEYPTPALRPANSRLHTQLLQSTFQIQLPSWRTGVDYLLDLIAMK